MISTHRQTLGTRALCAALGEPRSSWYRSHAPSQNKETKAITPRRSPRKLQEEEIHDVRELLHSERFIDVAPAEVHATLLDEGRYICSERTMYRILERHGETAERHQHAPRQYACPELLAEKPNTVWSWDITKLRGPQKWVYYYLYVILDIFSRYVVGWMIAPMEAAYLAEDLIAESCRKQGILPNQLVLHSDRGSSMTSKTIFQLLADLCVEQSLSRPHVSNDNPFSEAAFKTLKYHPIFPDRFSSIEESRQLGQIFFPWYNTEHRHSGIRMLTPETVHYGREKEVIQARNRVLEQAYIQHPERFVRGIPVIQPLPDAVYINPPKPLLISTSVVS